MRSLRVTLLWIKLKYIFTCRYLLKRLSSISCRWSKRNGAVLRKKGPYRHAIWDPLQTRLSSHSEGQRSICCVSEQRWLWRAGSPEHSMFAYLRWKVPFSHAPAQSWLFLSRKCTGLGVWLMPLWSDKRMLRTLPLIPLDDDVTFEMFIRLVYYGLRRLSYILDVMHR